MLTLASLAFVPTPLLLLIAGLPARTLSLETKWPYNLPPHMKYYPEDEALVRRNMGIQEKLASQRPIGVHKMSGDEGEMFFPEYWVFDGELKKAPANLPVDRRLPTLRFAREHQHGGTPGDWANSTGLYPLQASFRLHSDQQNESRRLLRKLRRLPRALLYQLDELAAQPGSLVSSLPTPVWETSDVVLKDRLALSKCQPAKRDTKAVLQAQEGGVAYRGALVSTSTVFVNPTITASPLTLLLSLLYPRRPLRPRHPPPPPQKPPRLQLWLQPLFVLPASSHVRRVLAEAVVQLIMLVGLLYAQLLQLSHLCCQVPRALASTFPFARLPMLPQRSLRHLQPVSLELYVQRAFTNAARTITVGAAASGVIAPSRRVLRRPQRPSWTPMELLLWLLQDQELDQQLKRWEPVAVRMDGLRARRVMEEGAV
ncbi:hypothetical protein MMC29_006153 [Sticta canariensis]|nr:hypothetical protein [Sticta canariensis]